MAGSGTPFGKIQMLSHLKSDDEVNAFIAEIRKHAKRDLRHKLIASVMAQADAQCHDTEWIANEALKTLRNHSGITKEPYGRQVSSLYDICPLCKGKLAKGTLAEHLEKHHTANQVENRVLQLNDDTVLNLLFYMQQDMQVNRGQHLEIMRRLVKRLSISVSLTSQPLPWELHARFAEIETETNLLQHCLQEGIVSKSLIQLASKVKDIRSAISLSLLSFKELKRIKKGIPSSPRRTLRKRNNAEQSSAEAKEYKTRSIYAFQGGSPGLGKRS